MTEFETVPGCEPSRSDCAHLAAATREPATYAALLRHLIEVEESAAALLKWEPRAVLPAPRAAHREPVSND